MKAYGGALRDDETRNPKPGTRNHSAHACRPATLQSLQAFSQALRPNYLTPLFRNPFSEA
jgi:hypothetical protein